MVLQTIPLDHLGIAPWLLINYSMDDEVSCFGADHPEARLLEEFIEKDEVVISRNPEEIPQAGLRQARGQVGPEGDRHARF
jgi:hypothetical protein